MNWKLLGLVGYFCMLTPLFAQESDSVQLTKNFRFADGVYRSFESFQRNQPDVSWQDVRSSYHVSTSAQVARVAYIEPKYTDVPNLHEEEIWGFAIDGVPYIRIPGLSRGEDGLLLYAALQVRGKICYFSYETRETRQISVSAYNPANGRPFRTGQIEREHRVENAFMLHFEDGLVEPFERPYFLNWIQDDERLYRTVLELTDDEVEEKLFKCLLIYVDRNAAYLRTDI